MECSRDSRVYESMKGEKNDDKREVTDGSKANR